MPSAVLRLLVAGSLFFLIGSSQEDRDSNEKKPFCKVFVSGPDSDDESSLKVLNEIKKKIKNEKKWFRLAEDVLEADIRVEVTRYGPVAQLKLAGGEDRTIDLTGLLDLESGYFIEFNLIVPQQFKLQKMMTSGPGPGAASKGLARRLRTICDTYCK